MVTFVNAKLNIGLNIIRKREDGYHLLETIFYPVGIHNGTPENPEPFCDILEAVPRRDDKKVNSYKWLGRPIDCPPEKNLVYRAAEEISRLTGRYFDIYLEKHLPDGAGLGGGSADASFTLKTLNSLADSRLSNEELSEIALGLGADCPFFIENSPAFGEGIGEILSPVAAKLKGMWALIVKPPIYVSTREAFAGITPHQPAHSVREIYENMPIEEWRHVMINDFESSLFPKYPLLAQIKKRMYDAGALYAQMSGSGSALFALFPTREAVKESRKAFSDLPTYICLL